MILLNIILRNDEILIRISTSLNSLYPENSNKNKVLEFKSKIFNVQEKYFNKNLSSAQDFNT